VVGEQRIDALQIGAGGEHDGGARRAASSPHAQVTTDATARRIGTDRRDTPRILAAQEWRREIPADARHPGTASARRLAVVLGVVTLTFLLLHLAPGDPIDIILGPTASAEQIAVQRRILGLDRPLPAQFVGWLGRFARGDWGNSITKGRAVRAILGDAWPATVRLVGCR